jgi:endogenous inhibitor of DNA gyrase (YacG/DUF329 family)
MQKVVIQGNTIELLHWPEKCPHCGQELREGDTKGYELKIRKSIRALFIHSKWKKLFVKLCGTCAKKVSWFKNVEFVGSVFAVLAFVGPIFLKMHSQKQLYVGGIAFWFGIILMAIAEVGGRKAIGLSCMLLSEDKLAFWFRSDVFRNEFLNLNPNRVERM